MATFEQALKNEINRIVEKCTTGIGKAMQAQTQEIRKDLTAIRKELGELEKKAQGEVATEVEKSNESKPKGRRGRPKGSVSKKAAPAASASQTPITSAMIRAARAKAGLSQSAFAKLVGVSSVSLGSWERKEGELTLRGASRKKVEKALAKVEKGAASTSDEAVKAPAAPRGRPAKKTAAKKAAKRRGRPPKSSTDSKADAPAKRGRPRKKAAKRGKTA